jgi:RNA polymerase sigma-70 factor (ECF subfamily)
MATQPGPDTEELLEAIARGDAEARGQLLERHRPKLRRMVAIRFDRRLAARVDPSDVVQESLAEAAARLPEYIRERPLPFYPWLRRIAADRLADAGRRHLYAGRRSVGREEPEGLPNESIVALANRLLASQTSPSARLQKREQRDRVRAALALLPDRDREVLVLRYLEDLSTADTAAVLGVGEGAVKMRLVRALQRLRDHLDEEDLP